LSRLHSGSSDVVKGGIELLYKHFVSSSGKKKRSVNPGYFKEGKDRDTVHVLDTALVENNPDSEWNGIMLF
jgi:hypothetical protein